MDADESQQNAPAEDAKAKFLAAIEAKKQRSANRPGVGGAGSGGGSAHGRAGGKREFRRKSGG